MKEDLSVTFETKCWEGDWRQVLEPRRLESLIVRHTMSFDERLVLVNNVTDSLEVMAVAEQLVKSGLLTEALHVPDLVQSCLDAFGLTARDLGKGYWYSTAELVGLRACTTRFLVHYAGDTGLAHQSDWVARGCEVLDSRNDVVCVNPVWNGQLSEVRAQSVTEDDTYSFGRGFSDQCFLVEAPRWRNADLTLSHPASDRFPEYGGLLFERRADSWMRSEGLLRATDKSAAYIHPFGGS